MSVYDWQVKKTDSFKNEYQEQTAVKGQSTRTFVTGIRQETILSY
jgi:hypothetical protein